MSSVGRAAHREIDVREWVQGFGKMKSRAQLGFHHFPGVDWGDKFIGIPCFSVTHLITVEHGLSPYQMMMTAKSCQSHQYSKPAILLKPHLPCAWPKISGVRCWFKLVTFVSNIFLTFVCAFLCLYSKCFEITFEQLPTNLYAKSQYGLIAAIVTINCIEIIDYNGKLLVGHLLYHDIRHECYTYCKFMNESHSVKRYIHFCIISPDNDLKLLTMTNNYSNALPTIDFAPLKTLQWTLRFSKTSTWIWDILI